MFDSVYLSPRNCLQSWEFDGHELTFPFDISITSTGKFQTMIFEKRDEFNFDIVKYPSINSNISDQTVYSVFVSQTLRLLRVCSEFNELSPCY